MKPLYEDWHAVNDRLMIRIHELSDRWVVQAYARDDGTFSADNVITMFSVYEAEARRRNEAAARQTERSE